MEQAHEDAAGPRTNDEVIAAFRSRNGRVGGMFTGAELVLLTTRGARSGRPHTTPVAARHEPDRILVFATNAGADRDPAWLFNLRADPLLEVEAPGVERVERFDARAVEQSREESARLYEQQALADPAFAVYRERTSRPFPVVALQRLGDSAPREGRRS